MTLFLYIVGQISIRAERTLAGVAPNGANKTPLNPAYSLFRFFPTNRRTVVN